MNTGISTLVELDLPLPELLDAIAAAGFSHVSLCHDVKHARYHLPEGRVELARLLAANGLKLNYIHPPIEVYFDLCSLDPVVRRLSIETLKLPIHAAAELGGQALTLHICNELRYPDEHTAERVEAGLESLRELAAYSAPFGIAMCVENQPNPYDSQALTLAVLRAGVLTPAPGLEDVWVTLDPNHARIGNPEANALVAELAPRVRATHFSDNGGNDDSHTIPGEGVVDYSAVSRALGRSGFLHSGPQPWATVDGYTPVVDSEASLWMQRRRIQAGKPQPGDPSLEAIMQVTPAQYLARCQAAMARIAADIEAESKL